MVVVSREEEKTGFKKVVSIPDINRDKVKGSTNAPVLFDATAVLLLVEDAEEEIRRRDVEIEDLRKAVRRMTGA